jgi:hypothetical protein
VKNTGNADHKRCDAGKKVSGIKRHIAVDTQGLPHAIAVMTAEVTDRQGALQAMDRCAGNLTQVKSVSAAERSFRRLDKCRRLWKNCPA